MKKLVSFIGSIVLLLAFVWVVCGVLDFFGLFVQGTYYKNGVKAETAKMILEANGKLSTAESVVSANVTFKYALRKAKDADGKELTGNFGADLDDANDMTVIVLTGVGEAQVKVELPAKVQNGVVVMKSEVLGDVSYEYYMKDGKVAADAKTKSFVDTIRTIVSPIKNLLNSITKR